MSKYECVHDARLLLSVYTYAYFIYIYSIFYHAKSHTAEQKPRVKVISMKWLELF